MVRILLFLSGYGKHSLYVVGCVIFVALTSVQAQITTFTCDTNARKVICVAKDSTNFVWEIQRFKDGQKWGSWQYFNATGQMIKQIHYRRNQRIWTYTYRDGEMIESINKKGKVKKFKGCGC